MAVIASHEVNLSQNWGVSFGDYTYGSKAVDFQDLMVVIAERRATSVEGEVKPLSTRISQRNSYLEQLGEALADLTRMQAAFESDDGGDKRRETMSDATYNTLYRLQGSYPDNRKETKKNVEYYLQRVKSKIDSLNNEAQKDMTRLQSLVDRRDEAFSTASDLMSKISDTRSNLIGNL